MSSLSRRAVLRGLGVCLALPWLESAGPRSARAVEAVVPKRFLVWAVPNGMPMQAWYPAVDGTTWTASPLLAPLERHRSEILILDHLHQHVRAGHEPHMAQNAVCLAGVQDPPWALAPGAAFESLDQLLARHWMGQTVFPSLELTSEGPAFCSEAATGQVPSCAGYSTLSWQDASTPLPRELSPRRLFDRLFSVGDPTLSAVARARLQLRERSILDAVSDDLDRLLPRVSAADQRTLDQFLTGVRSLERQLDALEAPVELTCASGASALLQSGALDQITDVAGHVDAMRQLIVLALQCDRTRVITYMLGNERSDRPFPHLGITASHHMLSHHQQDPAKLAAIEAIGLWEVEGFARLLDALSQVPEADGTLLDHTLALFLSPIADPDVHGNSRLPVVLAGRGGGTVEPGRYLSFPAGPSGTSPLAALHLTLAQRLGVPLDRFGSDGTSPLAL
jgi:hypothetical protein